MALIFSELPILLLLLPRTRVYKAFALIVFILFHRYFRNRIKLSIRLRYPIVDLIILAAFSYSFYDRWSAHYALQRLAALLGLSSNAVILFILLPIVLLSLPAMDAFAALAAQGRSDSVDAYEFQKAKLSAVDVLICGAIALLTALSLHTSPFSSSYPSVDSPVFLTIGRLMHDGRLPYRDIFDHKGPVLYLINWLGLFLRTDHAPFLGVWLLEAANMFVFACIGLKILRESLSPRLRRFPVLSYLMIAIVCVFCSRGSLRGGNTVQEYALPCIAIALRIFLNYYRTKEYRFRDIFVMGGGFRNSSFTTT